MNGTSVGRHPVVERRCLCCLSEKAMAPHSSTLAWKIPWTEEPGRLQSMGSLRVGHDWATSLSLFTFMHWRRKWRPTPVFLPGESQEPSGLLPMGSQSQTRLKRLSSSSSSILSMAIPPWSHLKVLILIHMEKLTLLSFGGQITIFIWPFWQYSVKWCIHVKSWKFKINNSQNWGFLILLYLCVEFVFIMWDYVPTLNHLLLNLSLIWLIFLSFFNALMYMKIVICYFKFGN